MRKKINKILVVGQTPPPFGGQAVMIDSMLRGNYTKIVFHHVRMAFSKEMDEIGKVKAFKIFHLFEVVYKIIRSRFAYNVDILYYPPTGPNKVPFYRDAFILILVRPFFRKTCFHFHAAGISELYPRLKFFSRFLFKLAYYNADLGIRLSESSTDDCSKLKVKRECIIPNGIEDNFVETKDTTPPSKTSVILFVGLLTESKGVLILINACYELKVRGVDFAVQIMGKFESEDFEKIIKNRVAECGLNNQVSFLGVLTGSAKFAAYAKSDIFCFPSFFEAENFPVVLLEAASFALPLVSTKWRGIPSMISDGYNGLLSPIKDSTHVAGNLQALIEDPQLRQRMGLQARQVYLERYSRAKFCENIENALALV